MALNSLGHIKMRRKPGIGSKFSTLTVRIVSRTSDAEATQTALHKEIHVPYQDILYSSE